MRRLIYMKNTAQDWIIRFSGMRKSSGKLFAGQIRKEKEVNKMGSRVDGQNLN